jgi:type IV pilus assembly protein PilY1
MGARPFQANDANGAKAEFHAIMDAMPTPQGNASHKYQGKELFFELFRYLTGQEIWNGHVGFLDYNGYPESGAVDPDPVPDPVPDPGDTTTVTICEIHKFKGTDTEFCDAVALATGEVTSCVFTSSGNSASLTCTAVPAGGGGGGGSSSTSVNLDVENPSVDWDASIESGSDYVSPLQSGGRCSKIFTVNVMFQVSQQDDNSNSEIEDTKASGGFGVGGMSELPNVIEYLNDADLGDGTYGSAADLEGKQNVTSYFIVDETKINTTTRGYATAGGTGSPLALTDDPAALVKTLEDVFKQILSVSTTFVSASVPINAFNRAEIIDNVFIAQFKTDPDGKPVWTGNVKKLTIGSVGDGSGDIELKDANNNTAIAADGRIRFDALTHWTSAANLPPADPDENEVDGKDGRSTTRGGAGQKLPGMLTGGVAGPGLNNAHPGGRTLYYDAGGSLAALNADAATATALQTSLGAADATEALELLQYARGLDVNDEDGDTVTVEAREWMHGDTLHSRPLPINFGATGGYSEANQRIYLAYGTNDGYMRLLENTTSGGTESGKELWGFMPQSVMGELPSLRANAAGSGHPYLVDGAPSVYIEGGYIDPTDLSTQEVYLYFGLRRGGKAYYALDLTDPLSPSLLWSIDKSGDFSEMGMTFSNPEVGTIDDGSDAKPVVIFGGGYDANKDLRTGVGTDDTEGNALYIVDGETGDLIWKAVGSGTASSDTFVHTGMLNGIPSTVTAVDTNGDGYTDRIYAGDTGGRVWRADIHGTDTTAWTMTLLADMGRHYNSSVSDDRRFFHRPDVIQSTDANGAFDAVVLGSGDRADPLDAGGLVNNFVYMIKDRNTGLNTGANTGLDHTNMGDITNTCLQEGSPCTADLTNGWRLGLATTGEKNLSSSLTIGGTVYFSTYLPPGTSSAATCGPDEGNGRFYAIKLANGAAVQNLDTTTTDLERSRESNADGIPSEAVYIPSSDDAEGRIMHNDYTFDDAGTSSRLRTFWLEAEDEDL